MFGVLKFVIYIMLFLGFYFQNATTATHCPVPPNNSLVYLNLNYHNYVDTPLLCLQGHDEECLQQKCCPNEVGCCLSTRSDDKHVRECGCKEKTNKICTFPSPYAILATSECGNSGTTRITACLREKRVGGGYLPNQMGSKTKDKSYRQIEEGITELLTSIDDGVNEL